MSETKAKDSDTEMLENLDMLMNLDVFLEEDSLEFFDQLEQIENNETSMEDAHES